MGKREGKFSILSKSRDLNLKVKKEAQILIKFIESTKHVKISRVVMKFLEGLNGEVIFIGIRELKTAFKTFEPESLVINRNLQYLKATSCKGGFCCLKIKKIGTQFQFTLDPEGSKKQAIYQIPMRQLLKAREHSHRLTQLPLTQHHHLIKGKNTYTEVIPSSQMKILAIQTLDKQFKSKILHPTFDQINKMVRLCQHCFKANVTLKTLINMGGFMRSTINTQQTVDLRPLTNSTVMRLKEKDRSRSNKDLFHLPPSVEDNKETNSSHVYKTMSQTMEIKIDVPEEEKETQTKKDYVQRCIQALNKRKLENQKKNAALKFQHVSIKNYCEMYNQPYLALKNCKIGITIRLSVDDWVSQFSAKISTSHPNLAIKARGNRRKSSLISQKQNYLIVGQQNKEMKSSRNQENTQMTVLSISSFNESNDQIAEEQQTSLIKELKMQSKNLIVVLGGLFWDSTQHQVFFQNTLESTMAESRIMLCNLPGQNYTIGQNRHFLTSLEIAESIYELIKFIDVSVPYSKISIISHGVASLIAIPLASKFPLQKIHSVVCINGIMHLDFSMKQSLLQLIHTISRNDVPLSRFQEILRNHCLHFLNKSQYFQSVEDRKLQSSVEDEATLKIKAQKERECRNILRLQTVKDYIPLLQGKLAIIQSQEPEFSNRNLTSQISKILVETQSMSYEEFLGRLRYHHSDLVRLVKSPSKIGQELREIIEKLEQIM